MAKPRWPEFDAILFACMLLLLGVGMLFIWSVSGRPDLLREGTEYRDALKGQAMWAGWGLAAFFLVIRVPVKRWDDAAPLLYAGGLAALLAVLLFGPPVNDARRWFKVGGFTAQPSEFMKVALVLVLARLLKFEKGAGAGILARVSALVAVPFALVLLQPDMGTALLFIPVMLGMSFAGGVRLRLLLGAFLAALLCAGAFLGLGLKAYRARVETLTARDRVWGLHAYQWRRIDSFHNAKAERSAGGFQAQQARIAIGSGGLMGKGVRNGTQTQLGLLPVSQSDFIFAVVGEEWGLMGTGLVVLSFGGILLSCFSAASSALDPFSRLAAAGMGTLIGGEALLNTGVVTGLLPVTGTPLPLVSQGGSSLVATCIALGIVQGIRMRPGFDLGGG